MKYIFVLVISSAIKKYIKLFVNETEATSILIYSNENYSKRPVRKTHYSNIPAAKETYIFKMSFTYFGTRFRFKAIMVKF